MAREFALEFVVVGVVDVAVVVVDDDDRCPVGIDCAEPLSGPRMPSIVLRFTRYSPSSRLKRKARGSEDAISLEGRTWRVRAVLLCSATLLLAERTCDGSRSRKFFTIAAATRNDIFTSGALCGFLR